MEKIKISNLESLLRFPSSGSTNYTPPPIVSDASILKCGCLVSESAFLALNATSCPICGTEDPMVLAPVQPLRELHKIIQQLNAQISSQPITSSSLNNRRRRSSSKKSVKGGILDSATNNGDGSYQSESMDLITLFYKFAKEEEYVPEKPSSPYNTKVQPIAITSGSVGSPQELKPTSQSDLQLPSSSLPSYQNSTSISPQRNTPQFGGFDPQNNVFNAHNSGPDASNIQFEESLLKSSSEEKEYNFSKCFPHHRKLTTFPTQNMKFNLSHLPFKSGSMLKKNSRYIGSSIHTYLDFTMGKEITRFVLITEKKWELFEYVVSITEVDNSSIKPQLICSGKSTGEYGENSNNLNQFNGSTSATGEIVIRNDFNASTDNSNTNQESDLKKRLSQWDHLHCHLSKNYLVISGTKGVMRVFDVNRMSPYQFGQPVYTYITNFPIRCIAISPDDGLIACGITARERVSGKEQPFIILHRLMSSEDSYIHSVDPITITIPYRDPIKIIRFNPTSTHLLCCTAWESRYLVIKLRSANDPADNYRKPRLIWSDITYKSSRRFRGDNDGDEKTAEAEADADYELMMTNEGITDLQFGATYSNTIVVASCSLKSRPPTIIRLDGALIDSKKHHHASDNYSIQNSFTSMEDEENTSIKSAETVMKITEVGSMIHAFSLSPRGDGIVFLDKDGRLCLLSTPSFRSSTTSTTSSSKRVVVLLGDVSNAERFTEAASVKFSPDGGKIFSVDRKGVFSVFDFTKGVPGEDLDVVKCKILTF
ncbi:transcriptional regulator of peptide transport [Scheffersomyces xylosifermentans]|uniref:transcriptional regulator of peptide transport n=1 Tax=Scheffersomyces xylosifermentans TaxID=1304137 RepID=UPI00315CC17D